MSPFEYLQNHVVSILKPSRISGVGFFAVRDIEEGTQLFTPWYGESGVYSITHDELFQLSDDLQNHLRSIFDNNMLYTNKNGVEEIVEKEYGKIFFILENGYHWQSIWPKMYMNSGLHKANTRCINNNNSITIRKIKKGEELLASYGTQHKFIPKNFI
jgi:hypothetical protein